MLIAVVGLLLGIFLGWKLKSLTKNAPRSQWSGKNSAPGKPKIPADDTSDDGGEPECCQPMEVKSHECGAMRERRSRPKAGEGKVLFVTPEGECWHKRRNCRGLGRALTVVARRRCRVCG